MNAAIDPHSAKVQIELHAAGRILPVAKLGPLRYVLREPAELPPSPAEIVIRIDGHEERLEANLPLGASLASLVVPIT